MSHPIIRPELAEILQKYDGDLTRLKFDLDRFWPISRHPRVNDVAPMHGPPGTLVSLSGSGFSSKRWKNVVQFAGVDALVVSSSATLVNAVVPYGAADGPITVEVDGDVATTSADYIVDPFPVAGTGGDGPPIYFLGAGTGSGPQQGVNPLGTPQVLVACCYATDRVPANLATARTDVMNEFDNATTYYDQVSYGRTQLDLDVTNWIPLSGAYADYVDATANNIDNPDGLNRIVAEAAQGAVDAGLDLDDYVAMAVVLFLNGGFIRAWGGWSSSNFSYSDANVSINLSTSHPLGLMAIGDNADWGRFAHEVGHNFVDAGAVLDEDVYSSDLIDGSVATAQSFDLMGNHDSHPCFSAHFMQQLGYWNDSNVISLSWDRNPFAQTYRLVAHGSVENASSTRAHAIRIDIGSGLAYYIEARERNGTPTNSLLFDTAIPVGSTGGGIVATKVFTDRVDINQEMRFVTLLHDVVTQETGATIEDPLRGLTIRVGNVISTNPLVIDVDVAWAQTIGPNPAGTFDLEMSQSGRSYRSDDIWVDRQPWGLSPEQVDGETVATLERPRPGEINRLFAKIRCNGADDVTNVKLTYYAISPPGVGDNGAWAPISTATIPSISANDQESAFVNWTPTVGAHTCLKVAASAQFGEITVGNNTVQENVFHFAAPASSPPDAVSMTFAVRNPRDTRVLIPIEALGVPAGYAVHVPNRWLEVDAKAERRIELTVVPVFDISVYMSARVGRAKVASTGRLDVVGRIPHSYTQALPVTDLPGSTHRTIGGIAATVTPKHRAEIKLEASQVRGLLAVEGAVSPGLKGQRVTIAVRADSTGDPMVVDVLTADDGTFRVFIPPKALPGKRVDEGKGPVLRDSFEVWAETTSAELLAPARSDSHRVQF